MGTVTKRDLAHIVAEKTGSRKLLTQEILNQLFNHMREVLIVGDRIEIRGFGVLKTRNTKPKPQARNPRTGEVVYVPARRKVHFKPGKDLKDALHMPSSET